MSQDMLTLLSISRSTPAPHLSPQTTDYAPPPTDELISGTDIEHDLWQQLRNSKIPSAHDAPVEDSNWSDQSPERAQSESTTLLNVRVEKITDTGLFNLRRRFANILGPDYAVALGYLDGPRIVVVFGKEPPLFDQIHYFRQYEDIELLHAPLECLDDFERITIVNGLNSMIVTATPGRIFTPAGGWHQEFYLKTCEVLDFDSILGLRIEYAASPPM